MPTPMKSKPSTAPSLPQVGYLDRSVLAVFPVGREYWDQGDGLQSLPYGSEPRSSETFFAFRGLIITSGLAGTKPLAFDK